MNHQFIRKQDARIVEDAQPCTHCRRVKSLAAFGVNRSKGRKVRPRQWCKTCDRISERMRDETPERKAWLAVYLARPDVRQRRHESNRRSQARETPEQVAKRAARKRTYSRSSRGKLMQCRSRAVRKLDLATGEVERDRLMCVIRVCDRELGRIDT